MKVAQLMTPNVKSCRPEDSLNAAAQIMWDNDCGCAYQWSPTAVSVSAY